MKLRIQANSIRYRLNRREVEEFGRTGRVEAAIGFATGTLRYSLEADPALRTPEASYAGDCIRVRVPKTMADAWAGGEEVGLTADSSPLRSGTVEIVVEKDFQCMHKGEGAKDPDAYPNPSAASGA